MTTDHPSTDHSPTDHSPTDRSPTDRSPTDRSPTDRSTSTDQRAADVTVIVCAYTLDRWDDIVAACTALAGQTRGPAQVILVADHNPALADRARTELTTVLAGLHVVPNTGARGLSGARNSGIAAATSPLIAFLDDDATPDPAWLEHLCAPFTDADVWVTGGRAAPGWPGARGPAWFPAEFGWVLGCSYTGLPTAEADVRNVLGCSMAFRAPVFDVAGLFREGVGRVGTLPLGCEETELCIRLTQARPPARIVYTPASLVTHRVRGDRTTVRYFLSRCRAEGLSKAQISATVGSAAATTSERAYATRVLPAGVLRGVRDALHGDLAGLGRAAAILAGLLTTTYGYGRGQVGLRRAGTG